MKTVRTRFGLRGNYCGHSLAELRIIRCRRNLSLPNCIERRINHDLTKNGFLIASSVQLIPDSREVLSVDLHGGTACGILGIVLRPSHHLRSWYQQFET